MWSLSCSKKPKKPTITTPPPKPPQTPQTNKQTHKNPNQTHTHKKKAKNPTKQKTQTKPAKKKNPKNNFALQNSILLKAISSITQASVYISTMLAAPKSIAQRYEDLCCLDSTWGSTQ